MDFVGRTNAGGDWSAFGPGGYAIANLAGATPNVTPADHKVYVWAASTSDGRGLVNPGGGRVAACWYNATPWTLDVHHAGLVSLYLLDWDRRGRRQRVEAIDPATGAVMDAREVAGFAGGCYLTYRVAAGVRFRVTNLGGVNAVVSGVFLAGA